MAQYTKVTKITPQEAEHLKEVIKNAKFVPGRPIPRVFDPQKRIEQLRTYLDPNHPDFEFEEHVNIKALIKLYEEGKIVDNSQDICVRDGKIITAEEMKRRLVGHGSRDAAIKRLKNMPTAMDLLIPTITK